MTEENNQTETPITSPEMKPRYKTSVLRLILINAFILYISSAILFYINSPLNIALFFAFFSTIIFAVYSGLYQLIIWAIIHNRQVKSKLRSALYLLPSIILTLYATTAFLKAPTNIERACYLARLASLPESAEIINDYGSDAFFSCTYKFQFKSNLEDINEWLSNSPGMADTEITIYDGDKKLVPIFPQEFEENPDISLEIIQQGDEINYIYESTPWFAPEINKGRKIRVLQDENADGGTIYIDEEKGMVWVSASHS